MSVRLHLPVTRRIATSAGPSPAEVELVNWAGVPLMLHENIVVAQGVIALPWSCSHETTGVQLATGESPEAALAAAIEKLRANYPAFRDQAMSRPILNPTR